ncbi:MULTISPECIES: HVO_2072 family ArtA-dependent S-layer glycoprotein [Haloferax]|uniref:HVO_2072 family ArtA-dependent S-layer glycoprotein n=1 Tax=Haloferax sp. Atlit-48N TaxID=2077198 RepID=A0ACD5HU80_9EURY|nr:MULTISPECIES: HVO_2072 family ArtA-dependent S-layer glycoprotein [Haloferax]MBC9986813.1 major cell surface glycoprotein [Haloferax sp. AS1]RDZ31170.1 major cell surface glycoprotein [Haloferax sp. Atlit-48N]WEL30242.1 Cell surface protein [Haloferax alexandrinus]
MTKLKDQTRAILLATLMVTSVFAGAIAFTGSAAAERGNLDADNETFNKTIASGDRVFLGEEIDTDAGLGASEPLLTGVSGNAEGISLDLTSPIPQSSENQPLGTYSADGNSGSANVTLLAPRITDSEIVTASGGDVTGSAISSDDADELYVNANYNYESAEKVTVTVEDPSGTDITNEVLTSSSDIINDSTVDSQNGAQIDMSGQDAGEYTIILEGAEDLDFGDASETMTLTISSQDEVGLELDSESVTQGTDVQYTVTNGIDGNEHVVAIDLSDLRNDATTEQAKAVFRNIGDTSEVGIANSSATNASGSATGPTVETADIAYAVVEIDGASAVGGVETQYLDDSDVDIEVYDAGVSATAAVDQDATNDITLTVEEGGASLSSPTGQYVVGSEVDINGTATSSDSVAIYVRDDGDWQLLEIGGNNEINVDSDDTFEEEDVALSGLGGDGSSILSLTGTYRIGVIDASDADVGGDGSVDDSLTTSEFTSGVSSSNSLRVTDQALTGQFTTINGQVAPVASGTVDVNGTASGANSVLVIFVDERGNVNYQEVSVDSDGTYEEDDITVGLTQGRITAHILSVGRDGNVGDGSLPPASGSGDLSELMTYLDDLDAGSNNGEQVNELIASETVDETASDDLIVTETFRLAESSTSIDSIYPDAAEASGINPVATGETMVIAGSTNLKPDDNTISIEVTSEDGTSVALEDTDEWNNDGQWMVEVDTTDFETGTFTVEADDGDNTDTVNVEIVSEREDTTTTSSDNATDTTTTDEPTETTTTAEPTETTTETEETTTTSSNTPGFGIAVALVALVGAALLALRREN